MWFACQGTYALVGGYSANVGYSVALLKQSGGAWAFVVQPDDGTCFAATSASPPPCAGENYSWPIPISDLEALASQAGLSINEYGDVAPPAGWTPPAGSGTTGTGTTGTGGTGNTP